MKPLPRLLIAAAALALSAHAAALDPVMSQDAAYRDMRAGRPYAGMPNLDKPVFIRRNSLICIKRAGLANPNIAVSLMLGQCIGNDEPLRVEVIRPNDQSLDMECRMFGYISVLLRAKAQSDASAMIAWVFIEDLTN